MYQLLTHYTLHYFHSPILTHYTFLHTFAALTYYTLLHWPCVPGGRETLRQRGLWGWASAVSALSLWSCGGQRRGATTRWKHTVVYDALKSGGGLSHHRVCQAKKTEHTWSCDVTTVHNCLQFEICVKNYVSSYGILLSYRVVIFQGGKIH